MMETLKLILKHKIDLLFGLLALTLLIIYFVNPENNFSGFFLLFAGYVIYNIISKVRLIRDASAEEK